MRDRAIEPLMAIALAGLCSLGFAAHASAHITKAVGPLRVSLGWGNEPAIAGLQNFVEVGVTESSGEPVSSATLEVQVASAGARITLPVRPAEEAGSYAATLIPTRPGTYSFHLTGEARGHQIDVMATCSEATFDCVIPSSEVEFPIKDPSTAELAQSSCPSVRTGLEPQRELRVLGHHLPNGRRSRPDFGLMKPNQSEEFGPDRWSRGHISGHARSGFRR